MLLVVLALLIIGMAAAVPKISQQIKRDREQEMIHRGVQYARGIKKYYKKFGRYPTSIEQLENTNNIRFIRKRYTDPMTPEGKWRFVRYGEVQIGQQGSSTPGAGGTGGALPGIVGGPLGQSSGDSGQPSGGSQNTSPGGTGQSSSPSGSIFGGTAGSSSSTPTGSMFGSSGTGGVFGGGPILGVASTSEKQGIHEFDKKSRYNQWLFVYDPNMDRGGLISGPYNPKAFMGQQGQVGTPAGQVGQPGGGMFGNNPGQPSGGMFGNSGGMPTQPQQPQQPQQNPQ
jgi:type II secretory pathway pseudopilin PulG